VKGEEEGMGLKRQGPWQTDSRMKKEGKDDRPRGGNKLNEGHEQRKVLVSGMASN